MSTDITEQAPIFGDFEEEQALGVVKGPSEEGSRYVFITSDNRRSKIG